MDAAEGESAFRPSETRAPSRKDAGRSGKRWWKRPFALIEPRGRNRRAGRRRALRSFAFGAFFRVHPLSAADTSLELGGMAAFAKERFGNGGQNRRSRRFGGWKYAVHPCPFRFDASCRRPFRRRTRLCAVRRLKLKLQFYILQKRNEIVTVFFFFF